MISDLQMKALEVFIALSRDATELGKRAIIYALRHTRNLTNPVCLSVPSEIPWEREFQDSAHDMLSSGGTTHLGLFLRGMGSDFRLQPHSGYFVAPGKFDPRAGGRTIWWSSKQYDRNASIVEFDKEAIESLELPNWDELFRLEKSRL